jgi:glucose/arabinose dehydrogenase
METAFATGLTNPRGLAFDSFGNLFVAENNPAPDGDILKFAPGGAETVFASGIDLPEFLTFGPPR